MGDMTEQERLAFQAQAMGVPVPAQPAPPPPAPVAAPAQQSSDPNAPNYINPQSPYYKSPTARGAIQLGNAAPPQAAPPVDPNKYAQQSDDPNAPGYVNPQSPFYNPHAPKPVAVEPAAPAQPEAAPIGPPKPPAVKFASTSASPAESGGASATPSINWGGAGGGTATISAHEVPLASKGRQNEVLGAIDNQVSAIEDQKAAIRGSGEAAANIAEQEAAGKRDIAKATADAGAETASRAKLHADESKAFRAHIDNFAAKLATDKIDPNAMWNNSSTGQKITWTLAKAFGAIGQAFLHTSTNQIADHIEAMAAQDVAGQRANHEIGREHLNDMKTMYGEALRETGNAEDAERVATGYALEAAKQQAQALALSATGKASKAKAEETAALLGERQAQLGEKRGEKGIALNPMAQARTVGTGGVDMNKVYSAARQYIDEQAKLGTKVTPDEAIRWSYKLHTGADPLPGAGSFAGGAKAEPGSKTEKLDEARTEVNGGIATIDRALESGAPYKQGPIGAMWAHVPGATNSKIEALDREKYDAQVKSLVGAAWRMTTGGVEPKNPNLIEEQAAHYEIHPSDTAEVARARMLALQQALRDAAGNKGVIFDAAQSGKVVPSTFAK